MDKKDKIETIRIFFSWQSDLPDNQTSGIVKKALNNLEHLYTGSVNICVDMDMRNTVGMLDISEEILLKINQADIFVADLTIVTDYYNRKDKPKHMSNPNVLFELGYAASVLTWNRVASVANIDFGDIEKQPFDINHRSILKFSLKNDKANAVKNVQSYLNKYIVEILKNGKQPKKDSTYYKIGSFGFVTNEFSDAIIEYDFHSLIDDHISNDKKKIRNLIDRIETIKVLKNPSKNATSSTNNTHSILKSPAFETNIQNLIDISEEIKDNIVHYCQENDIPINNDSFFNLGNLIVVYSRHIVNASPTYKGTESEKEKYKLILELNKEIDSFNYYSHFFAKFDGINALSIALNNCSSLSDENISIVVSLEGANFISPLDLFTDQEIDLFEPLISDDTFMEELFVLPSNNFIEKNYGVWPRLVPLPDLRSGTISYSVDDIKEMLVWYFADAIENNCRFDIQTMNSTDVKWIGPLILIKGDLNNSEIKCEISGKNLKNGQIIKKTINH